METELQDGGLAVYPRTKVLFQPTDRTHPNVLSEVAATHRAWFYKRRYPKSSRSQPPCV